jgi:hypothetical protein
VEVPVLSGWRNREGGPLERALLGVAAVLVVNTAMLVAAVGVVTLPLGLVAGSETLYRWRHHHEEYLVATFTRSLRHHVRRRMAIGWTALASCAWGVAVVTEGVSLVRPWRLVVPAVGVAELLVAVPFTWLALGLAWASDAPAGPILRTALLLTVQMPPVALGLDLLTVVSGAVVLADPLLVVVGLVALAGFAAQWLIDRGLARRGVVLWQPPADSESDVSSSDDTNDTDDTGARQRRSTSGVATPEPPFRHRVERGTTPARRSRQ